MQDRTYELIIAERIKEVIRGIFSEIQKTNTIYLVQNTSMVQNGLLGPLYLVQVWLVQQQHTLGAVGPTTPTDALIHSFHQDKNHCATIIRRYSPQILRPLSSLSQPIRNILGSTWCVLWCFSGVSKRSLWELALEYLRNKHRFSNLYCCDVGDSRSEHLKIDFALLKNHASNSPTIGFPNDR